MRVVRMSGLIPEHRDGTAHSSPHQPVNSRSGAPPSDLATTTRHRKKFTTGHRQHRANHTEHQYVRRTLPSQPLFVKAGANYQKKLTR